MVNIHELTDINDKENNAIDKGPWQVDYWVNKNNVVLQSQSFERDVALIIDGDFGGDIIVKKEYASRLADWMNQQLGKKTPITKHYIPLQNAKD